MLTTANHRRDSAGLTHVYPVISRRSGGLSVGINLNPNNACNWQCAYCQVENLQRGAAPAIDLNQLGNELRGFLDSILHGDFYDRYAVPEPLRNIRDIAISGNGEPTSAAAFDGVVALVGEVAAAAGLIGKIKLVLITNGSLTRRETVQRGLAHWARLGGQAWFKLDSATAEGAQRINGVHQSPETLLNNLSICAELCPTWLQTCLFAWDGEPPGQHEQQAYVDFLHKALRLGVRLEGVMLYGLARPPMQAQAARLSALPAEWLEGFAARLRQTGLEIRCSP